MFSNKTSAEKFLQYLFCSKTSAANVLLSNKRGLAAKKENLRW